MGLKSGFEIDIESYFRERWPGRLGIALIGPFSVLVRRHP